ncbi:hypothetical protein VTH82DRAFT_6842 [Thermothelomyces myriococcoides]
MQLKVFLTAAAALASSASGANLIFGTSNMFVPTLPDGAEPGGARMVWTNEANGVSIDRGTLTSFGPKGPAVNEHYCNEGPKTVCPIDFSIGGCSGTLQSVSGSTLRISLRGPRFNHETFGCFKNTSYETGNFFDGGRINSLFVCYLGAGSCWE